MTLVLGLALVLAVVVFVLFDGFDCIRRVIWRKMCMSLSAVF